MMFLNQRTLVTLSHLSFGDARPNIGVVLPQKFLKCFKN